MILMAIHEVQKVAAGEVIKSETVNEIIDVTVLVQGTLDTHTNDIGDLGEKINSTTLRFFKSLEDTKNSLSEEAQIPISDLTTRVEALEAALAQLKSPEAK